MRLKTERRVGRLVVKLLEHLSPQWIGVGELRRSVGFQTDIEFKSAMQSIEERFGLLIERSGRGMYSRIRVASPLAKLDEAYLMAGGDLEW